MNELIARWNTLIDGPKPTAELRKALWYVAYNLSTLIETPISAGAHRVLVVPTSQLAEHMGDMKDELVGIYLLLGDDLPGQAILMLTLPAAFAIANRMLNAAPGTTSQLGELERSALGELGNIAVSSFLNVVAQPSWGPLHPSPPAVMVEKIETILDAVVASIATTCDSLTIAASEFHDGARAHSMRLWIIPNPDEE